MDEGKREAGSGKRPDGRQPRLASFAAHAYLLVAVAAATLVLMGRDAPTVMRAGEEGVRQVHLVRRPQDPDRPLAFEPAELTIRPGTTVRWVNDADVFHTVTFTDSLETNRVPNGVFDRTLTTQGESAEFRFDTAGVYPYYCQPHAAFMAGTVRVTTVAGGGAFPDGVFRGLPVAVAAMLMALAVRAWRRRCRTKQRREKRSGRRGWRRAPR